MQHSLNHLSDYRQQGAALLAGLILLIVVSTLAISNIDKVNLGARYIMTKKQHDLTFQAAEVLIRREARRDDLAPLAAPGDLTPSEWGGGTDVAIENSNDQTVAYGQVRTRYIGSTPVAGFQMSDSNGIMRAFMFESRAVTKSTEYAPNQHGKRGRVRVGYRYYIVGPSAS